jgi:hypothetical protein
VKGRKETRATSALTYVGGIRIRRGFYKKTGNALPIRREYRAVCSLCRSFVLLKAKIGLPSVFWYMTSGVWLGQCREAAPNCEVACAVFDVTMLALVIVCFTLAAAYASSCAGLE